MGCKDLNLWSMNGMQTSYYLISIFRCERFVGKQHTARALANLLIVGCFTGNLVKHGKIET